MGKITVKHYLNTKIKPINGEYPIYIHLTYKRKNNYLKSFTETTQNKEVAIKYANLNIAEIEAILNDAGKNSYNDDFINSVKFTREKIEIEKAFEIIESRLNSKNFQPKGIKYFLSVLMQSLEYALNYECWQQTLNSIDREKEEVYYDFYNSFNKEMSLSEIIGIFEIQTDFRFDDFLKKEHIELWESTQLIKNELFYNSNALLIDYFLFDMRDKLTKNAKYIKNIDNLINSIISKALENTHT